MAVSSNPVRSISMELKFVDPRALKGNPDKARRSKSSPQADALLLATIRAVGKPHSLACLLLPRGRSATKTPILAWPRSDDS